VTRDLEALRDWLAAAGVTHVGMESTGVYLRINERLEPYRMPHALLMQIPGVDWLVAAVIIAEIGVDMGVFLSVYHLSAWAGVCPGSHESAGRRNSGRARKGGRSGSPRDSGETRSSTTSNPIDSAG
jgi:hypothetical protein